MILELEEIVEYKELINILTTPARSLNAPIQLHKINHNLKITAMCLFNEHLSAGQNMTDVRKQMKIV
jgi:hypothetical protein